MSAARWERLADDFAAAGVPATIDITNYPGGVSRSILIRHDDTLITVMDRWWNKNDSVWIGWSVAVEGVKDSIIRKTYPLTKKRSEVVAHVAANITKEA